LFSIFLAQDLLAKSGVMAGFSFRKLTQSTRYIGCALAALFASQGLARAQLSGNGNLLVPLSDPQIALGAPVLTNGQVQLTLNGEPGISYIVESSPDLLNWTAIATNNDSGALRILTLEADAFAPYYRVSRAPRPLAIFALATRGNMALNSNGQTTDSFNSTDPAFSTDGQYDKTKPRTNGTVASAQGIVNIGSHVIGGNVVLGKGAQYTSATNQVLGVIVTNETLVFPYVVLPNVPWLAAPRTASGYDFTADGYYSINDNSNLVVEPGVTVVLNVITPSFNSMIQILGGMTNAGTAYIFLNGPTNAVLSQYIPKDTIVRAKHLCIFGLPALNQVAIGVSNTNFTGVVYAPSASTIVNGGGTADGFTGALVVGSILMNGHVQFHFDEDLLTNGPCR